MNLKLLAIIIAFSLSACAHHSTRTRQVCSNLEGAKPISWTYGERTCAVPPTRQYGPLELAVVAPDGTLMSFVTSQKVRSGKPIRVSPEAEASLLIGAGVTDEAGEICQADGFVVLTFDSETPGAPVQIDIAVKACDRERLRFRVDTIWREKLIESPENI